MWDDSFKKKQEPSENSRRGREKKGERERAGRGKIRLKIVSVWQDMIEFLGL